MNGKSVAGGPVLKTAAELLVDIRNQMLDRFACRFSHELPDALEAGICSALTAIERSQLATSMDEEDITSALLGALVTGSSISAAAFPSSVDEPIPSGLSWAGYHKSNGKNDWDAESKNGADFALVIWQTAEKGRLTVFQSKRTEKNASSANVTRPRSISNIPPNSEQISFPPNTAFLNVHRRPPRRGQLLEQWRRAQMEKLFEMGRDVQRARILLARNETSRDVQSILSDLRTPFPPLPKLLRKRRESFWKLSEKDQEKTANKKKVNASGPKLDDYFLKVKSVGERQANARKKLEAISLGLVDDASLRLRAMTWIHYLAYLSVPPITPADYNGEGRRIAVNESELAVAVPLANLGPWRDVERRPEAAAKNYIDLSDVACRSFSDLLLMGATANDVSIEGWLEVDRVVVDTMLPQLLDFGPVVFLRTGEALQLTPSSDRSLDSKAPNTKLKALKVPARTLVIETPLQTATQDINVDGAHYAGAQPMNADLEKKGARKSAVTSDSSREAERPRKSKRLQPLGSAGPGGKRREK
jgi:hypothetical protein